MRKFILGLFCIFLSTSAIADPISCHQYNLPDNMCMVQVFNNSGYPMQYLDSAGNLVGYVGVPYANIAMLYDLCYYDIYAACTFNIVLLAPHKQYVITMSVNQYTGEVTNFVNNIPSLYTANYTYYPDSQASDITINTNNSKRAGNTHKK